MKSLASEPGLTENNNNNNNNNNFFFLNYLKTTNKQL